MEMIFNCGTLSDSSATSEKDAIKKHLKRCKNKTCRERLPWRLRLIETEEQRALRPRTYQDLKNDAIASGKTTAA